MPTKPQLPITVNVIIRMQNDKPMIELRRCVTDPKEIKAIVSAAWWNQFLIISPKFNDRMQALNSLQEKGILLRDSETGEYNYTF